MPKLKATLHHLDLIRPICHRLCGAEHTFLHRAVLGATIMLVGVYIAKTYGHQASEALSICCDALGYSLHGIGLVPFVEAVIELGE